MELSLFKQVEERLEIDGTLVVLHKIDPLLQARMAERMMGMDAEDLVKQVEVMEFVFSEVVKEITYKDVPYDGLTFFKMLSLTKTNNQTFVANTMARIIEVAFVGDEEEKKSEAQQ